MEFVLRSQRWPQLHAILVSFFVCLLGWLVGFLTSSSTTRLYRGRAPRQSVWQFYVLPHMRQSWETMTSISVGHIILTPTQPVGSGRPLRESTWDLLTRSCALYRLSYRALLLVSCESEYDWALKACLAYGTFSPGISTVRLFSASWAHDLVSPAWLIQGACVSQTSMLKSWGDASSLPLKRFLWPPTVRLSWHSSP